MLCFWTADSFNVASLIVGKMVLIEKGMDDVSIEDVHQIDGTGMRLLYRQEMEDG